MVPVYCDDSLIWDYTNDNFIERMKNNSDKDNAKIQEELDNAIKQGLDIDLIPVNLRDCIEIALENSSRLKIMRHQQKEAKWMYVNAISELLPDFYYRYQLQDLRGEFLVGDILPRIINANPVYSGFNISYPIIGNGSPLFTIASQKKLYRAAGHDYNYSKDELLLNTALRYYALLEAKLGLEVLLANLRDRYEQQKLMKARYEIGVGTKYDVLRADAELAIAKKELVTQLNSLRLGQADLADIMGIDITIPLYPVETNARVHKLVDTKYNIAIRNYIDKKYNPQTNADFVKIYGGDPVLYTADYRRALDADALETYLKKDHDFKYATVVHCDTPSGMLNDISRICPLLKRYGILTVVDSVSAMFGEEIRADDFGTDILCGGSQKALSAPPGLAFVTISPDADAAMHGRKTPVASFYANLLTFDNWYENQWFPYTMPVSDIHGLRAALENVKNDPDFLNRHARIAEASRAAVTAAGLRLHQETGFSFNRRIGI